MKKNRIIAIFLVVAVIATMLIACSKNKEYNEEEVTVTEIVTDANGEAVTNENGETETVVIEVPNGNGNSGSGSSGGNSTGGGSSTTSPLATTEAPAPIPPEDNTTKKNDIEMSVVMPFFSNADQEKYKLVVTIGKKELVYDVVGCKGQTITVVIPKGYNGDKATFSVDMRGKVFSTDAKIQKESKVVLQTIVIVDGDDD